MRVKCINECFYNKITKNKTYSVVMCQNDQYLIKNDKNMFYWYTKELFEVVDEDIKISNTIEITDLDSKIKELQEQLDILMKAKEIMEK